MRQSGGKEDEIATSASGELAMTDNIARNDEEKTGQQILFML